MSFFLLSRFCFAFAAHHGKPVVIIYCCSDAYANDAYIIYLFHITFPIYKLLLNNL